MAESMIIPRFHSTPPRKLIITQTSASSQNRGWPVGKNNFDGLTLSYNESTENGFLKREILMG